MTANFHLPGLFEFYEFYKVLLPIYSKHKEYFYDWAQIASVYGAPGDCLWSGGRIGGGENNVDEVFGFLHEYKISARITFSNSLLEEKYLDDKKCNGICESLERIGDKANGVIVHSELLLKYLRENYPGLYFVSSTTKVITDFEEFEKELKRDEFLYVVPDFRLNKKLERLKTLSQQEKDKVEFLVNECCFVGCKDRKECYENVSRKMIEPETPDFNCNAPESDRGYLFSKAIMNPSFIGTEDILNTYLPSGFSNFKIEGRSLGSAIVFEMILYYMVKPEYHLIMRENVYLDSMLDLF